MKIAQFIAMARDNPEQNYLAECSDMLGLTTYLTREFKKIAHDQDVHVYDAKFITREKSHQIDDESRRASYGGTGYQHFIITKLQDLPAESVGPLLKTVEEAKYSRFIFQAQHVPAKVYTLKSRATAVKIPFITENGILAAIKARNLDAGEVQREKLWDGTLDGSLQALNSRLKTKEIRKKLSQKRQGMSDVYDSEELMDSPVLDRVIKEVEPSLTDYLQRVGTESPDAITLKRRLALLYCVLK